MIVATVRANGLTHWQDSGKKNSGRAQVAGAKCTARKDHSRAAGEGTSGGRKIVGAKSLVLQDTNRFWFPSSASQKFNGLWRTQR